MSRDYGAGRAVKESKSEREEELIRVELIRVELKVNRIVDPGGIQPD
jgi:hypothetical protein